MIGALIIVIALIALLGSALYSGGETGIYTVNRIRLRLRVDRGERPALALSALLENEHNALTAMLVGTNIMNYVCTAAVAYGFAQVLAYPDERAELYTTLIVTPLVFVFGEVVPKTWFHREAEVLMYRTAAILRWTTALFRSLGILWLLRQISVWLLKHLGTFGESSTAAARAPRRRIAEMLHEGMVTDGEKYPEHREMIDRVLGLSKLPVHQTMIPRNRMVSIANSAGRPALLSIARRTPHSRLPVFQDQGGRVIGILNVREALYDHSWKTAGGRAEPAITLDPHQTVASAILALQSAGQPMAIVANRSGRTLGLVTLKDLLEEIVGDLPAW